MTADNVDVQATEDPPADVPNTSDAGAAGSSNEKSPINIPTTSAIGAVESPHEPSPVEVPLPRTPPIDIPKTRSPPTREELPVGSPESKRLPPGELTTAQTALSHHPPVAYHAIAPSAKPRKKFVVGTDEGVDDNISEHGRSPSEAVAVMTDMTRPGEAVESHRDTKLRYVKPYPTEEMEKVALERTRLRSRRLPKEKDGWENAANNTGVDRSLLEESTETARTPVVQASHHPNDESRQSSSESVDRSEQRQTEEQADPHASRQSEASLPPEFSFSNAPSLGSDNGQKPLLDSKRESVGATPAPISRSTDDETYTRSEELTSIYSSDPLETFHAQRHSSPTISRTQQKLMLQRQHFLAEIHPWNEIKLTKVMERINREHTAIRMYRDPIAESLSRVFSRFAREHPEILDEDYGRGFGTQDWNDDSGRKNGEMTATVGFK